MLTRLAHLTVRRRWLMIGAWLVLTVVGAFAAGQVSSRWYQSSRVPGKSAYEASQRTLTALGAGARTPNVVVFHTSGDATKSQAIEQAIAHHGHDARRADQLVLLDRGLDVRVARPAHDIREGVPGRPAHAGCDERCRDDARRGCQGPAGRHHRQRHRP